MGIIILGAGALARETYDWCRNEYEIIGFYAEFADQKFLHDLPIFTDPQQIPKKSQWIMAVGNPKLMRKLSVQMKQVDIEPHPAIIHSTSRIGLHSKVGLGSICCPNSIITCDVIVGTGTIIDTGCIVTHDCIVGDYVHLAPGTILAGGVTIEDGCELGVGAKVIPRKTIAKDSIIGAGSVVIKDMPSGTHVGVPARTL